MKYEMGQRVWYVSMESVTKYAICPDCLGAKQLRVILGDGTEVAIDCAACDRGGYQGSRGNLEYNEYVSLVVESKITGIAIDGNREVYTGQGFYNDGWERVFATKEEAEAAGMILADKYSQEQIKRAHCKEKDTKTWAWHVKYHRRCAERAQRDMLYHQEKMTMAKVKSKEVIALADDV